MDYCGTCAHIMAFSSDPITRKMEIWDKFSRYIRLLLYCDIAVQFRSAHIVVDERKNVYIMFYNGFTVPRDLMNSVVFFFSVFLFWVKVRPAIYFRLRAWTSRRLAGAGLSLCVLSRSRRLAHFSIYFSSFFFSVFFFFVATVVFLSKSNSLVGLALPQVCVICHEQLFCPTRNNVMHIYISA
jgi:hypothetical protein